MRRLFIRAIPLLASASSSLPVSAHKRAKSDAQIEVLIRTIEMLSSKVDSLLSANGWRYLALE